MFQTEPVQPDLVAWSEPYAGCGINYVYHRDIAVLPYYPPHLTSHWSLGVTATGTQRVFAAAGHSLSVVARSALTGDETRSRPQRRAMAGDEIDPDREPVRDTHCQKLAKLAARVASINKPTEEATEQPHGNCPASRSSCRTDRCRTLGRD